MRYGFDILVLVGWKIAQHFLELLAAEDSAAEDRFEEGLHRRLLNALGHP